MENIEKIYTLFLESEGICTDSRKLQKNQIFFALKGENFNGNFFAQQALTQGALAVVVDEINEYLPENALTALQELAKWHRIQKKKPTNTRHYGQQWKNNYKRINCFSTSDLLFYLCHKRKLKQPYWGALEYFRNSASRNCDY